MKHIPKYWMLNIIIASLEKDLEALCIVEVNNFKTPTNQKSKIVLEKYVS